MIKPIAALVLIFLIVLNVSCKQQVKIADVCVYGGTASGIMAGVAAAREGSRVIIVEPGRWLGGMTGGGISTVDWGREQAVGGSTLKILNRNYTNPDFRKVFREMVEKHKIEVLYEHRLSKTKHDGKHITLFSLDYAPPDSFGIPIAKAHKENAINIRAKVFIDCSYEGDLLAHSGAAYTFGRESRDKYGESFAGVRPNLLEYDIDPYIVEGDSASGLLPSLQDYSPGPLGTADQLIMGYCLRFKLDMSGNGIPIPEPGDYDPLQFELLRRGFKKGLDLTYSLRMRKPGKISVKKKPYLFNYSGTGNTNRSLMTTTVWGINAPYPEGDWATRAKIWKFHHDYLKGLLHFIKTDQVVPQHLKELVKNITFQRGAFDDTGGWPHQLYVREARRMVSDYVITQNDLEGKTDPAKTIGLASYGVDDWPYATIVNNGKVAISGGEFSEMYLDQKYFGIYKIPYSSIVPSVTQCTNLIVPVCISASHIAMTSIRMEPVWMILGESAGVAAAMAVKNNVPVQNVNYDELKEKLLVLGQILERPAHVKIEDD